MQSPSISSIEPDRSDAGEDSYSYSSQSSLDSYRAPNCSPSSNYQTPQCGQPLSTLYMLNPVENIGEDVPPRGRRHSEARVHNTYHADVTNVTLNLHTPGTYNVHIDLEWSGRGNNQGNNANFNATPNGGSIHAPARRSDSSNYNFEPRSNGSIPVWTTAAAAARGGGPVGNGWSPRPRGAGR